MSNRLVVQARGVRRRDLLASCLCCSVGARMAYAAEDRFPNRAITILVPYPPGGSNDVFARVIADQLTRKLGQPVIVENRPGASGLIGLAVVARARADGYTLALVSSSFTTAVAVQPKLTFDPVRDFQPVARINSNPLIIVSSPRLGAKTLEDLIAIARKRPKQLNYGSSGVGSMNQFAAELFASAAGIQLVHVPYRGMNPAMSDLASGQIDLVITSLPSAQAFLSNRRVVALATTGDERMPGLPTLPTCREAGLRGFTLNGWSGVLAPSRTPPAIVALLNAAINEAMTSPESQKALAGDGSSFQALTPSVFAGQVHNDLARWREIAKAKSIQVD